MNSVTPHFVRLLLFFFLIEITYEAIRNFLKISPFTTQRPL